MAKKLLDSTVNKCRMSQIVHKYATFPSLGSLACYMSKTTTLFLSNLLDILCHENTQAIDLDGRMFYFCSVEVLSESPLSLGWTYDEQARHFQALTNKDIGILTLARAGKPGKRCIHIDMERLEQLLRMSKKS